MLKLEIDFYKQKHWNKFVVFKENLYQKEFSEDEKNNLSQILNEWKNTTVLLFLNGEIIGEAAYLIEKNFITILQFRLLEKYLGNQMGKKLIDFLKSYYKDYNIEVIVENGTLIENGLINYYKKLGFEIVDQTHMRLIK
ncbi:MAG: GNAT family N-acetyltransferase [Nanoarchaeota archaeon]|nr:GNAT family N-acetyltransferase [Nanoarchaeota archaeon]